MSSQAKRSLQIGLLVIVALPVTALVLALFALVFLHTSTGQAFVLGRARAYLAENFKTKIDYTSGTLDIFSGAQFKDLHIVIERPDLSADIKIPLLALDYDLGILSRQLTIKRFHIERPNIQLRMVPTPSTAQPAPIEGKPAPPAADRLRNLLENPPLRLALHDFALDSMRLDAELPLTQVHVHDLSLALTLGLSRHFFMASGDLRSAEPISIVLAQDKDNISGMDLALQLSANAKWQLSVKKAGDAWLYEVKPNSWDIGLSDVHLARRTVSAKTSTSSSLAVDLPKVNMAGDLSLTAKSAALLQLDSGAIETLDLKNDIDVGGLALAQTSAGSPEQAFHAKIAHEKITVLASLTDKIVSRLKVDADGVEAPMYLTAPVSLGLIVDKSTSRDLLDTSIKSTLTLSGLKLVQLDAVMKREQANGFLPFAFNGTLALTANAPALSRLLKPAVMLKHYGPMITVENSFDGRFEKNGMLKLKLATHAPDLKIPQAKHPIDIALKTDSKWSATENHLEFGADIDFASPDFGHWQINSNSEAENVLVNEPNGKSNLQGIGHTQITEVAPPEAKVLPLPVRLEKPIRITHKIAYRDGHLIDADVRAEAPLMDAPNFGRVADTVFDLQAKSRDLAAGRDLDVKMDLTQGRIEVHKQAAAKSHVDRIEGAFLHMKAALAGGSSFTVNEFEAGIANKAVRVSATARGDLALKDVQARADFAIAIPEDFPALNGKTIRGSLDFPVTLAVLRGRQVNLQGRLSLAELGLVAEDFEVRGVSGIIPISEKFDWDGKKIHFIGLIQQNPFERVDFGRWQPLLAESDQLRIGAVRWQDKTYGPFVGFFEIRQNMVLAHEFNMDFGNGRAYGEMAFNMDPSNLQLDLLTRITNLNLFEVLPSRFLTQPPTGNQTISARSGLAINLSSGSIDGRIDVTEIGGSQLITMLNLVDPRYQDDKINKLRHLLEAGYPTGMKLAFSEGYMDMDIDLSILGIPQSEAVHGVPVSSLITSKTAGIVQMIGKGPF